jgi:hypothetical protein
MGRLFKFRFVVPLFSSVDELVTTAFIQPESVPFTEHFCSFDINLGCVVAARTPRVPCKPDHPVAMQILHPYLAERVYRAMKQLMQLLKLDGCLEC